MEAARPGGRRQRVRRGTVDKPLNVRLVRVAAIVVAPAFAALLFSVSTTGTLPRPPLDPVFDEVVAAALAAELETEHPSRAPGTAGAEAAALWYSETVSALGLPTDEDAWEADIPDLGRVGLRNIATVIPGRSDEAIVVVAHRDNAGVEQPLGDNSSGTAALIELARGYAPQGSGPAPLPRRTLVLLSTDGGAYGGAGVRRFADVSPYATGAFAAIVLDGIGGRGKPRLAVAGDGASSPARALVATASARIEEQAGAKPLYPSAATQLVDLALPFAAGEQGPLLDHGIATVTLTTADPNDPDVPAGDPAAPLAVERFGRLGRATESLIGSIDASAGGALPTRDSLFLDDRAASGWTLRLTLIVAVVPFALGLIDLLVRTRRMSLPLRPAARALRARLLLWVFAGVLVWLGAFAGIFPTGDPLPLPPYSVAVEDVPYAGLALLGVAFALGWLLSRRRISGPYAPTQEERLAGYAVGLAGLGIIAVVVAVTKPYGLLFLLPSLYAWLWLPLASRAGTRIPIFLAGLLGPLLGLVVLARQLDLGILDAPLYVIGLATVGYIAATSVVVWIAWAALAAQFAALAFGRYAPYAHGAEPPPPGPVRLVGSRLTQAASRRKKG